MLKKIITALLITASIFSLTACQGSGGSTSQLTGTDQTKQVEITFSCWETGLGKEVLTKAISKFEDENPDIKVNMMFIPSEYQVKLTAMSVSETLPDLGYFSESSVLLWAQNQKLMDLSAMFEKEPLNDKLPMVKFTDADGKVVAAGVANEILLLFYNKDLFDEAGIAYPPSKVEDAWTWDEFVAAAKTLTKDRNGNRGDSAQFDASRIKTYGVNLYQNNLIFETLMWSNGGGIVDYDTEEILLDKPETIEVLQAIQDLIYVQHASPTPVMQGTLPTLTSALTSGTVAMCFDMQNNIILLNEAAKAEGLNYGIGVMPKFKQSVSVNGGAPIVIFQTTKYPEQAKRLFTFLMDPENTQELINSGLWMPNERTWYTDEDKIDRWLVDGVHVPEYRDAVINYTMSGAVHQNSYYYYRFSPHLLGAAWPAIDRVYRNSATPEDAVASVMKNLQDTIDYVNSPDFEMAE